MCTLGAVFFSLMIWILQSLGAPIYLRQPFLSPCLPPYISLSFLPQVCGFSFKKLFSRHRSPKVLRFNNFENVLCCCNIAICALSFLVLKRAFSFDERYLLLPLYGWIAVWLFSQIKLEIISWGWKCLSVGI